MNLMKQLTIMKKKLLAMALFLLPVVASASEIETVVDNLKYVINTDEKTAVVDQYNQDVSGAVVIPETVEYEGEAYTVVALKEHAFYANRNITSVAIPNTVTEVSYGVFDDCTGLLQVNIPASVTSFGTDFAGCVSLSTVNVDRGNPVYDSRSYCNAVIETATNTLIAGCYTTVIPEGITTIGERAFYNNTSLTSIKLPESLVSIEENAFYSCGLTEVVIPDNVEVLGMSAFNRNYATLGIIGRKVSKIRSFALTCTFSDIYCYAETMPETEDYVFYYDIAKCQTVLHVPEALLDQYKTTAPWKDFPTIVALKDGDPSPTDPVGGSEELEIDGLYYKLYNNNTAMVTYNPSVPNNEGCYTGDVVIPASVTYEGVDYDVTSIGDYTFQYSHDLTSVTVPESVTSIGECAFQDCLSLASLTLPSSVTSIGVRAFEYCQKLASFDIPENVTRISQKTFHGCIGLTSIHIPDGVTVIENSAFDFCAALTSVTIPDKVEDIGKFAFENCLALKTVTLGKGVKNLYEKCFNGCDVLNDVYCQAENVPWASLRAFNGEMSVKTLHVPEGSLANYQKTEPWSYFGTIVALTDEETAIRSIGSDGASELLRFTLDGRRINSPQKGLNIIKTRDGRTRKVVVK